MKNFTRLVCTVFIVILSMLYSNTANATHFKGGDTYFVCLGNGQYQLVFACYYACEPGSSLPYAASSFSWAMTSNCGLSTSIAAVSATTAVDVPFYCPGVLTQCDYNPYSNAPANAPVGTLLVVYKSAVFTIPAGCTVSAIMDNGSRNGAVSNLQGANGYDLNIQATLVTPADGSCNNNPQFAQFPVNIFCVGQNANFSQGAIDLDGDSLSYTLINPRTAGGTSIPFVAGCTPTNPLGVGSANAFASVFTFNTTNGNINFTPTAIGGYVLTVQVNAYHNGVLVGSTMRDIQFSVVNCNFINSPPTLVHGFTTSNVSGANVIDTTRIGVCPGQQVSINLMAIDPDLNNYIIDSTNVLTSLPGSTISVTHTGTSLDTATLHILWTPSPTDSGFRYFLLSMRDTFCPTPGRNTYTFIVSIQRGLAAGPDLIYCNGGQPVTITAHGSNHYTWTDSATGGPPVGFISFSPDSSSITVAPGVTSGYVVHGDLLGSCKNLDTVIVRNAALFSLHTVAQDTSVCKYTTTVLTTTPTPNSVGPFTYSWGPTGSTATPTAGSTATTPILNNSIYNVSVTSVGGCLITDSVRVVVNGSAPRVSILPVTNNVCPGDTVTINSLVLVENLVTCGLVDTCATNNVLTSAAVGNDTMSNTGNAGGTATGTFCSPFMGSRNAFKAQYLFTKAELNAAGLSSGAITDISFFVKQLRSTAGYDTFTVSMGCTTQDSLTGFINNLLEVVPAQIGGAAIFPNQGWSPLPFTHYFNWDGSSNLVIQICYTMNSATVSADDFVSYSTTAPVRCITATQNNARRPLVNGCAFDASAQTYRVLRTRPNIKFGMCTPNILTYQWTPHTALCDNCPTTQVVVNRDSTYKLTVSDGLCINDTVKRITINPYLATSALPDTTVCAGDTVQLHFSLSNLPIAICQQNYTVTSIPYVEIQSTGGATPVPPGDYLNSSGTNNTDDGVAGPYPIGFNFPFYCDIYTDMYINSNGWISFVNPYPQTTGTLQYIAQTLPPTAAFLYPKKTIDFMASDYYLDDGRGNGGGDISYFINGTTPNQILVIVFNNMRSFTGTFLTSGEMHLYESDGLIEILLKSSDYSRAHTTGVKDSTGIGIAAPGRNNQTFTITTPEAWSFRPGGGLDVALGSFVWSQNTFIDNDSSATPLVYPPSSQSYHVDGTVLINKFSNPEYCHVSDSVRVNIDHFNHTLVAAPSSICPKDTAHITFNPLGNTVTSYVWTPSAGLTDTTIASPLASPRDTTMYYVHAVDNNGCKASDSIRINVLPVPTPVIGPSTTVCYSDSLKLILTGPYANYQWYSVDTVTGVKTPLTGATRDSLFVHPTGYYTLQVSSSSNNCLVFSNTVEVDSFTRQKIAVDTSGPTSFCIGGSVVLSTTQGINSIQWTPSSFAAQTSFPVTAPGTFSYTARDVHNCLLFSDTVTVKVKYPAVFVLNTVKNPICSNDVDTLVATTIPAGALITWAGQGVNDTLRTSTPGTFNVHSDLNGCANDTTITLTGALSPSVMLPANVTVCADVTVTAAPSGGTPGYSYLWSDGSTSDTAIAITNGTNSFSVTVTDANHCTAVSNVQTVTINRPTVDISITPKDTLFPGDSTLLSAIVSGSGPYTYQWVAQDSAHLYTPTAANSYVRGGLAGIDTIHLTVTDPASGCSFNKDTFIVVVEFGGFAMATAFTPNGDGKNDFFYPVLNGPNSPTHISAFRIYNRWGQLIYDNPNAPGWDGNFLGNGQTAETYMYFLTVEYPDPSNSSKLLQKSVQGSFQLLR